MTLPTRAFLLCCCICFSGAPHAADNVSLSSPSDVLAVAMTLDPEGRVSYSISRRGELLVAPSRLGFLLADAPKLERNFQIIATSHRSADDTWEQPWGERRFVRDRYNELTVRLREKTALARELVVVFRLFDDGVGFRYEFPDQPQLKQVNIAEELTEFAMAQPATATWQPGGEWNRYEYLYNKTPLDQLSQAHTPVTLKNADGVHIAIHEAALVDYASMWLRRVEGQRLKTVLSPAAEGAKVKRTAPFNTPWRTLQIADDAPGLYMSNLILNLNEPNKLGDVSWFKPYKYIGIWWAMHLDQWSWASGPTHGATTEHARRYIDFAAKNGFRGVLIEGWNEGWDGDWFANGESFSFTKPYPDFDINAVAEYARRRGVHLIGHHETSANIANYEPQLSAALDLYQRLGIDGVKTGYVADAGGVKARGADGRIHFEWHDGQVMSRHHLLVVTEAAKRHIAIDTHEPIKDTGLRRTYPNWVAREGARGMEYNAWGNPPNPPNHEANLVFTRMLGGPMDFTPGVVSLTGRGGQCIQSTLAKQLALYVVIYSPIQMAADLPENYEKSPAAFQFIKDVPADWSDTRVLNGEVGEYATLARKDRNSENWYLGSVGDDQVRNLSVKLDFLDPGRRYTAQIYRDGDDADWRTHAHSMRVETRSVTSTDTLALRLAPGGGAAVRFVAGPAVSTGRIDHFPAFESQFVAARNVDVWLPPGYDPSGEPLPVIYMHDGQNLFDARQAYGHQAWGVDRVMERQMRRAGLPAAIIVGVWNTAERFHEYMPQKVFEALDPELRARVERSQGGPPVSDRYLRFLVSELKPFVDHRYHTRSGARDTSIMGSSMGGLISLYAMAEYPDVFGQAAGLSTHWPLLGFITQEKATVRDPALIAAAFQQYLHGTGLRPARNRLYLDHGTRELDANYAPYAQGVDAVLQSLGWQRGPDWQSRVFAGAAHDEKSWRARLDQPLGFLLARPSGEQR